MVYSADLETIRDIEKSFSSPYISNIVEYKEEVKEEIVEEEIVEEEIVEEEIIEEPKKTLKSKKK
jgi:Trk K+ transport system NAD-binding subunit